MRRSRSAALRRLLLPFLTLSIPVPARRGPISHEPHTNHTFWSLRSFGVVRCLAGVAACRDGRRIRFRRSGCTDRRGVHTYGPEWTSTQRQGFSRPLGPCLFRLQLLSRRL